MRPAGRLSIHGGLEAASKPRLNRRMKAGKLGNKRSRSATLGTRFLREYGHETQIFRTSVRDCTTAQRLSGRHNLAEKPAKFGHVCHQIGRRSGVAGGAQRDVADSKLLHLTCPA